MDKSYEFEIKAIPEATDHMVWLKIQYIEDKLDKITNDKNKNVNTYHNLNYDKKMYVVLTVIIFIILMLLNHAIAHPSDLNDKIGSTMVVPFCSLMTVAMIYCIYAFFKTWIKHFSSDEDFQLKYGKNADAILQEKIDFYNKELARLRYISKRKYT